MVEKKYGYLWFPLPCISMILSSTKLFLLNIPKDFVPSSRKRCWMIGSLCVIQNSPKFPAWYSLHTRRDAFEHRCSVVYWGALWKVLMFYFFLVNPVRKGEYWVSLFFNSPENLNLLSMYGTYLVEPTDVRIKHATDYKNSCKFASFGELLMYYWNGSLRHFFLRYPHGFFSSLWELCAKRGLNQV